MLSTDMLSWKEQREKFCTPESKTANRVKNNKLSRHTQPQTHCQEFISFYLFAYYTCPRVFFFCQANIGPEDPAQ